MNDQFDLTVTLNIDQKYLFCYFIDVDVPRNGFKLSNKSFNIPIAINILGTVFLYLLILARGT